MQEKQNQANPKNKMRYLKNNGKPTKFTVSTQVKCGYVNKKGERKEIRVVMWRDKDPKAFINKDAIQLGVPENKKAVIRYLIRPDKRVVEETDERKDIGYVQIITNFPHILNFPIGTSFKDERVYNIMVGEIAQIENDSDADEILKAFHFVDEVDEKGELIDTSHYLTGHPVKGNPYRPEASERPDRRLAPKTFEEFSRDAAPRQNDLSKRVREIRPADEGESKMLREEK